jgi:hypothetical protein
MWFLIRVYSVFSIGGAASDAATPPAACMVSVYYRNGSRIMAVEVKPGATFQPAEPHFLFEAPVIGAGAFNRNPNYAVTADGQKFLAVLAATDSRSDAITVLLNWQAGLKK